MADTHHLTKRNNVWYFMRRVPKAWRSKVGKEFFKVSLGTGNLAEAKTRRTIEELKADAMLAELAKAEQNGIKLTKANAQPASLSVLLEYVRNAVSADDERSRNELMTDPPSADELLDMKIEAETDLQILQNPDEPERHRMVQSWAKPILTKASVTPEDEHAEMQFAEWVRRGLVELARRRLNRFSENFEKDFHDKLFDPAAQTEVTFGALTKIYWAEKKDEFDANGVSEKRADKVKAVLQYLDEAVGSGIAVSSIDDDVVQKVRTLLAKTPANRTKLYGHLPLEEAIKRGVNEGKAVLSSQTQRLYLEILKGVLKVARRKKLLQFNPAEDVKPIAKPATTADQKRLPLTNQQLLSFFGSSFFQSCAPKASLPYDKPDRDWRFWMPLVMVFMGPRPNEVAQLMVRDIKQSAAGTWYLDMVEDHGEETAKSLKTSSSRRRIPLHPELERIGFLSFVEKRRKDSSSIDARLFPNLKPNKYGNRAWYAARRFNEVFLPAAITLGPRQSLYSLRHNVRDALRRINAPADALLAIAGWSPSEKAVSDDYGDPGNPDLYTEWVAAITYPGLDLSFLYV